MSFPFNIVSPFRSLLLLFALCLGTSLYASPKDDGQEASESVDAILSRSSKVHTVNRHRNQYTGKHNWWSNYQFFPELKQLGIVADTTPDLKWRFGAFVNGGYAGLSFSSSDADSKRKFGWGLGGYVDYFFSKHFGARSGLEFSYASSKASMGHFSDSYFSIDQESDIFRYNYSFDAVDESYDLYLFNLPIQVVAKWEGITLGAGIKLGFPVTVKYSQTVSNVTTEAYFPQYDVYVDDSHMIACGNYSSVSDNNKYTSNPMLLIGTFNFDYFFKLNNKHSLGIGAYIDYSFNTLVTRHRHLSNTESNVESLISTTGTVPLSVVSTSMLSSKKDNCADEVVSKVHYLNLGLRLSYTFNSYGAPKAKYVPY